jgi:hypothetical protein
VFYHGVRGCSVERIDQQQAVLVRCAGLALQGAVREDRHPWAGGAADDEKLASWIDSHATLLMKHGVHPKVASERLGHADITLTLRTYSHV